MPVSPPRIPMPVVFVGHGTPFNALAPNRWNEGFAAIAAQIPKPRAILAISAHWFVDGTLLTASAHPKTIHDFYGFPQDLYDITYPAPGHVDLAGQIRDLLGDDQSALSADWGLDHGTWSVLRWMYPAADIPVVQLSMDRHISLAAHLALGESLNHLRREGILILASGNTVHNLSDAIGRRGAGESATQTPLWAEEFDAAVARAVSEQDEKALLKLWPDSPYGRLAHPTVEHFLPLLYAQGAAEKEDQVRFVNEGFDYGSLGMRCIVWDSVTD